MHTMFTLVVQVLPIITNLIGYLCINWIEKFTHTS